MGTSEPRIAIIGAGIGGLALGLALRERGIAAEVFEQAPELTEIGAAIGSRATPHGSSRGWACWTARRRATIPTELMYRQWRTGDRIAAHPVATATGT